MKESKNIPEIRFKGFEGEWEELTLGDMGQITMGQSPSSVNYTTDSKYHILVQGNSDMKNGKVTPRVWTKQVTKTADSGDLIISVRAPVGDVGKTSYNVVIGRGVAAIKANEFVFQSLIKKKEFGYWDQFSTGSTFESINSNVLKKAIISTTSQKEQSQIGTFFQNLDQQITLEQQKHDKLVTLKKAMLEKMFPKEGASVPEIRLKGSYNKWVQDILENVTDVRDGTHASPKYQLEGHPFITSKNLKNGDINYEDVNYITDSDFNEINKRSNVDVNDILMGMIGTIGNIALIRKSPDFAIKNVALIKDIGRVYYLYLYYFLQTPFLTKQLSNGMDGGTQKFIALNKIRKLSILFPSKEIQSQIGTYFQNLDKLISLQQQKIDKLKNIKKACLDKMFV